MLLFVIYDLLTLPRGLRAGLDFLRRNKDLIISSPFPISTFSSFQYRRLGNLLFCRNAVVFVLCRDHPVGHFLFLGSSQPNTRRTGNS